MKIEDQVCSLEQAKMLHELGVEQKSLNWWKCNDEQDVVICGCNKMANEKYFHFNTWYSAFTVAELGMMLPNETYTQKEGNTCEIYWKWMDDANAEGNGLFPTEAQARAAMLISRLIKKRITVNQVNQRLNQ